MTSEKTNKRLIRQAKEVVCFPLYSNILYIVYPGDRVLHDLILAMGKA